MSVIPHTRPSIRTQTSPGLDRLPPRPRLRGMGTAVPSMRWTSQQTLENLAPIWHLRGAALDRWRRIVEGTAIDVRHGVVPPERVVHLSTAQRMALYEEHAPPLAVLAAQRALEACEVEPSEITDLIVVSCTGFSAPGLDVELTMRLGLPRSVRRTLIGFMGCYGGITGLRTAVGACAANPGAVALVVCCELCSLHVRPEPDVQNQVATALFADGAAAAIVSSALNRDLHPHRFGTEGIAALGSLDSGASLLLDRGREWMTWRITDAGFAMTLAREVPVALRQALADFVGQACVEVPPQTFIVHPGGAGILDAADQALGLCGGRGLDASREVLRRIGNVSSATVLFVLEEALRRQSPLPAMLLAFGPGLTLESLRLFA